MGGYVDQAAYEYDGTIHAIQCILEEEGLKGFYRGMGAKMFASVFAAALMLVIKEKLTDTSRTLVTKLNKKAWQ